jgi:hypothetical protein
MYAEHRNGTTYTLGQDGYLWVTRPGAPPARSVLLTEPCIASARRVIDMLEGMSITPTHIPVLSI